MAIRGWLTRSMREIEHDPEMDRFRTLWQKEHLKEKDFALLAGLNVQTVHRIFSLQTKRPQHLTYHKMAVAMGYSYTLTRDLTPNYEVEIPKARDEFKEHQSILRKKRERAAKRKNGGHK
jgi:hypothetical protein